MAGNRIYITVPQRDRKLIARAAMGVGQCSGQWSRQVVLTALYRLLQVDKELIEYDQQLSTEERSEVLAGGR